MPSKHIIQVPLCHDVRIFLLQCLEDCQAVCVSAHLGGSPRHTSLEGAIDSLCYTPPVMPFWWLRAAFNSSHQWFYKNTLQSLLEVLSVNPWEIPMAPGKKSRVPAGSPGRLHHCCRTMNWSSGHLKAMCQRKQTRRLCTSWSPFPVCLLCPKPAAASLAPEQAGPSSGPYHIFLLAWLAHWLCDWCDFPLSVWIFICLHQGSNQTARRRQRPNRMMFKFWTLVTNKLLLGFFLPRDTIAVWLQMAGNTRQWCARQDPRSSGLSATPCRSSLLLSLCCLTVHYWFPVDTGMLQVDME